jgi:hypothetical protein
MSHSDAERPTSTEDGCSEARDPAAAPQLDRCGLLGEGDYANYGDYADPLKTAGRTESPFLRYLQHRYIESIPFVRVNE